jgi:serine/threonine protein kinase
MSLVSTLIGFGLRQVIGDGAEKAVEEAVEAVKQYFRDHGQALPRALAAASDRAWRTLGVALAGDGFCDQVKRLFASGDDKGFRKQVAHFLSSGRLGFEETPVQFRRRCLAELRALRRSGLLSAERLDVAAVVERAGHFARYGNTPGLVAGAWEAVHGVADALADDYPNLARLLRQPATGEPPLLASAFTFFFRREVENNPQLARGLTWDSLRQLSAAQEAAFAEVEAALAALGGRFDEVLEGLGRIEQVAAATHGAVLDLRAEWQRLSGLHQAGADELRQLMEEALARLARLGMQTGEMRPQHSFSIRGEDERAAVRLLLTRFRQLPAERQQKVPALLNALGKLQVGAGEFAGARRTFLEVIKAVGDPAGKAEASFNAYRAALEEGKWEEGLQAVREAASLDAGRFAPFPLYRYEPRRILGAGGFGTAFLCRDHHFEEDVVVKALHAADLERGAEDVFREARVLRGLSHRAIIGIRDCDYADPSARARPYLVMDYVPGVTLGQFVGQRGALTPGQLLAVAVPVAAAMREAHAHGILHRDLKPENILVRKEGDRWRVKIIDFGLALQKQVIETSTARAIGRQTVLGRATAGTLLYAPPEQMGRMPGVKVGPYSDVYAFGKTCCYALFRTTEPKRRQWSTLPAELAELLEHCTEQELERRHADFDPVLNVLESLDRHSQQQRHGARALGQATGELQRPEHGDTGGQQATQRQSPENPAPCPSSSVLNTAQEYLARAEAHRRKGDYDRAMADASEAIRLDPRDARGYGLRATAYLGKGELSLAIRDADHAIRLDRNSALAYCERCADDGAMCRANTVALGM